MAEPMRAPVIEYQPEQVEKRKPQSGDERSGLMTPARRAALDALERELHEFLKAVPR
ncbi:MAG: hypothetical protein WCI56_15235 [Hyphomicrobiales bacterium]